MKREITFIGFAYKKDVVRIKESNITLKTIVVDNNENEKHICSFYEKFSYYKFGDKANISIEIDSANRKLLDTILVLTDKNIKPLVSFEDLIETKFRRRFFVTENHMDHPDKN